MFQNCLIKVFYASVVVQALCVVQAKPKMAIQTALFILTITVNVVKHPNFINTLLSLIFAKEQPKDLHDSLNRKEIYRSRLYQEIFKFIPVSRFSYLQIFSSFAYDKTTFSSFLEKQAPKFIQDEVNSFAEDIDPVDGVFNNLSDTMKQSVRQDQDIYYELLGIKGLFTTPTTEDL